MNTGELYGCPDAFNIPAFGDKTNFQSIDRVGEFAINNNHHQNRNIVQVEFEGVGLSVFLKRLACTKVITFGDT